MPLRSPIMSRTAASCGSLLSRKRAAMAMSAGSSVMLTESVARAVSALKSGSVSLPSGSAASATDCSSISMRARARAFRAAGNLRLLGTRVRLAARRRRGVDDPVGEVELLARDPQRLDQLLARLQALQVALLVPLALQDEGGGERGGEAERQPQPPAHIGRGAHAGDPLRRRLLRHARQHARGELIPGIDRLQRPAQLLFEVAAHDSPPRERGTPAASFRRSPASVRRRWLLTVFTG